MNRFTSVIATLVTSAILLTGIPLSIAAPAENVNVDIVVRGESSLVIPNANVYLYTLDETTDTYSQAQGPLVSSSSGRVTFNIAPNITFYAKAWDSQNQVYADSNFTWANIWRTTDANSIVNVETGSTRSTRYVHIYPGLYEAIDPATPTPTPTPDPAPVDPTSPANDFTAAVDDATPFSVQVTVYDELRNPMQGVEVKIYVTNYGLYSSDDTDGAGRTQETTAPIGYEFYAIATDQNDVTYGGIYDYYYDRANYWTSSDGESIENISTGLTRLPYLHLFPEELVPAGFTADSSSDATFDPTTYECGDFPDAVYEDITPEECAAIEYAKAEGIFTGTEAGFIEWNRPINRAEVTKVILEAFDTPALTGAAPTKIFPDVPQTGLWFSDYIYRALQNSIVGGYPDGYFRPENTINRVELLRIFIEASDVDYSATPITYSFWHDITVDTPPQWYMAYANYAFFNDLLNNDGNLYPAADMTRMDVIRLIYRSSLLTL